MIATDERDTGSSPPAAQPTPPRRTRRAKPDPNDITTYSVDEIVAMLHVSRETAKLLADDTLLSTEEAAELLAIQPQTLRRYIRRRDAVIDDGGEPDVDALVFISRDASGWKKYKRGRVIRWAMQAERWNRFTNTPVVPPSPGRVGRE